MTFFSLETGVPAKLRFLHQTARFGQDPLSKDQSATRTKLAPKTQLGPLREEQQIPDTNNQPPTRTQTFLAERTTKPIRSPKIHLPNTKKNKSWKNNGCHPEKNPCCSSIHTFFHTTITTQPKLRKNLSNESRKTQRLDKLHRTKTETYFGQILNATFGEY